jgi:hypothetical protein
MIKQRKTAEYFHAEQTVGTNIQTTFIVGHVFNDLKGIDDRNGTIRIQVDPLFCKAVVSLHQLRRCVLNSVFADFCSQVFEKPRNHALHPPLRHALLVSVFHLAKKKGREWRTK